MWPNQWRIRAVGVGPLPEVTPSVPIRNENRTVRGLRS